MAKIEINKNSLIIQIVIKNHFVTDGWMSGNSIVRKEAFDKYLDSIWKNFQ